MRLLFVKSSSLGDVVHHMPAVSDARRHLPDAHVSWLVEENYEPLVRLHGGVDEVITVATRRWRRAPLLRSTWREIGASARALRRHPYDVIVDTQGLARSALFARMARGRHHGYNRASVRESAAALLYDEGHAVPRGLHAVTRNRLLTGAALGYDPLGAPDYGLRRPGLLEQAGPYAVFLHGSARPEKEWPEAAWLALGRALQQTGLEILLPQGSPAEEARAARLAAALPRARVLERQGLDALAATMAGAKLVVGLDTGLLHLAAALRTPLAAIFTTTDPELTGPVGSGGITVLGGRGIVPEVDAVLAAAEALLSDTDAARSDSYGSM